MSICAPCQVPHTAEECEDTRAGRAGMARACFCQHKPRTVLLPPAGERTTEVIPGRQGEVPGGVHRASTAGREHGDALEFCPRDGGGCPQLRRRDCCPGRRRAAHDLSAHRGRCTALEVRCEAGRHLLITDAQDSLVWSRDAQQGWAVGAYRDDAAEEPESFLHHQRLHHPSALLPLVRHTLCSVRQPRAQEGGR